MKKAFALFIFTCLFSIAYSQPYEVGLNNELGGYVLYVTPNGQHGLVVTTQDQGISNWYGTLENVVNPDYHNDAGKEFTDWRMPSTYEMNLIYEAREDIGGFEYDFYWTSLPSSDGKAWGWNFETGYQEKSIASSSRHGSIGIRAVRSF